ncbi:MAG: YjbH domain-containing protein [Candidatus Poribacteria bacterium]|nr:YjbH domain-containing protein [Candidatus Poribacteria bacterium]
MRRSLFLLLVLVFVSIMAYSSANGEVFTESGLVDIPTGAVLEHGIFGVGTFIALRQSAVASRLQTTPMNLGDAVAIRLNFGLFDRIEIGLGQVWNAYGSELSTEQAASLKVQLLKEQETGAIPSIAIGVEHLGDGILTSESEKNGVLPSAFLAVSKTFNLPRIHQFSGHIGIGTQRFAFGETPIGVFVGLGKEFQPAFARGDITMSLEFDGSGVNAGMRYITSSGLQVALGAETLNDPDALRYLAAVSWTNERLIKQIDETRRLIQRATQLAVEAKRAITEPSE